jgi:hypothetical protein
MDGNVVFISYFFESLNRFSPAIHCNYIKRIELNDINPTIETIRLKFSNVDDFKFLNGNTGATTGYSAHKLYALVQLVQYIGVNDLADVKPDPALWKKYELTHQIVGYPTGNTRLISPADMVNVVFEIPLSDYYNTGSTEFSTYNLNYLSYPVPAEIDKLCFGDETYFFGTVESEVEADVYTTDLSINLALGEFNSTTNPTWDGVSSVAISEVGIYDKDKNLVAIGKLNNPIIKDSSITRTISFAIDF